jgi:hypothetical protein
MACNPALYLAGIFAQKPRRPDLREVEVAKGIAELSVFIAASLASS